MGEEVVRVDHMLKNEGTKEESAQIVGTETTGAVQENNDSKTLELAQRSGFAQLGHGAHPTSK